MTREEAIKWFEKEKEDAQRQVVAFESCFKCFKSAHRKIVVYNEMAIAALREQEERSKGCEYCTDSKSIYEIKSPIHDSYNTDVYVSENALVVDIGCHSCGSGAIHFCPMCGRRLEEV